MKRLILLASIAAVIVPAQEPSVVPRGPRGDKQEDVRLPNGKSQRDEMLKVDYKRNLEDAAELAKLSAELKDDLEKNDSFVVSVKTLKKLDDIAKLTRNIRGRLNRY